MFSFGNIGLLSYLLFVLILLKKEKYYKWKYLSKVFIFFRVDILYWLLDGGDSSYEILLVLKMLDLVKLLFIEVLSFFFDILIIGIKIFF